MATTLRICYAIGVGESGSQLLGGQCQRNSKVCGFMNGAQIVGLDEPASASDSESMQTTQLAINDFTRDKTTVAIAWRWC